jgi:hypothetical protein
MCRYSICVDTKFYDRNMALAAVRATIERFQVACEDEPLVIAAFLGGSLAAASADDVSDLDLYVITRERDYEAFFASRQGFISSWGEALFLADTLDFEGLGFDMTHFVLADGVYGELAFGHEGNFGDLHGGPFDVLIDKTELLAGHTFPLYEPSEQERRAAVEHALAWFFYDGLNLGTLLARGRLVSAAAYLARLRAHCVALLETVEAQQPAEAESLRERLLASVATHDVADMWEAAFALIDLHQLAGAWAAARHDLAYPDELARLVRQRLLQESGASG